MSDAEAIKKENLEKFWEDLAKYCKITYIVLEKEKIEFVSPDIKSANTDFINLVKKFEMRGKESYIPYINAMKKIIDTSPRVMKDILKQPIDILNTNLRSEYRDYLRDGGWKCFLVHHPLELPVVMALILNKINENDTHLKTFLKMIKLNDLEACAEASFQRILDKMESTST